MTCWERRKARLANRSKKERICSNAVAISVSNDFTRTAESIRNNDVLPLNAKRSPLSEVRKTRTSEKVGKGEWWMPRLLQAMKDVISCDKLREGANNL